MREAPPISALLFNLPVDAGGSTIDGVAGFRITATGGLMLTDKDRAIRQSIMILLSTRPGERVMRPDYGCPLHRLAFEPADAATAGLAIHYIRTALTRWEPRIEIVSLRSEPDVDMNVNLGLLSISLEYRVRITSAISTIHFNMDLQGENNDAISGA